MNDKTDVVVRLRHGPKTAASCRFEAADTIDQLRADNETARTVLHLWMGGWRPEHDQWVWGWDRSKRRPVTDAQRSLLGATGADTGTDDE